MKTATLAAALLALAPVAASAQSGLEQSVISDLQAAQSANVAPAIVGKWVQPANRKEKCAVYFGGTTAPSGAKWFGDCANGKASGLGIGVIKLPGADSVIAIEEYRSAEADGNFTYRQINVGEKVTRIHNGVSNGGRWAGEITEIGKTAQGNPTTSYTRDSCFGGECTSYLIADITGTSGYAVRSARYQILWSDVRADSKPVYSRRLVTINGIPRAEKYVLDDVADTIGILMDVQRGQPQRAALGPDISQLMDSPRSRYLEIEPDINRAVAESIEKVDLAIARFCPTAKDADVLKVCDPSILMPSDFALAPARAELNQAIIATAGQIRGVRNQAMAAQQQAALQQAQLEQARQQQNRQALMQGIQALNQAGQQAQQIGQQMQQYQAPQVQYVAPPAAPGRTGVICRTIANVTYCN